MEQEPVEKKQRKDVDEAKEEYVKEMNELSKTYLPGILKKIVDVERLIKMDIKNEELVRNFVAYKLPLWRRANAF